MIEQGNRIVATGTLVDEGAAAHIVRMSVAADHRRMGLGRQLVEALVEEAQRRNFAAVRVSTDTPWTSAIALYVSCGFEAIGRDVTDTHFELSL